MFIELDGLQIIVANLEIDFGATEIAQTPLHGMHQLATVALPLKTWIDSEIINPASVSLKSSHDRSHHLLADHTNQEQLWLH